MCLIFIIVCNSMNDTFHNRLGIACNLLDAGREHVARLPTDLVKHLHLEQCLLERPDVAGQLAIPDAARDLVCLVVPPSALELEGLLLLSDDVGCAGRKLLHDDRVGLVDGRLDEHVAVRAADDDGGIG